VSKPFDGKQPRGRVTRKEPITAGAATYVETRPPPAHESACVFPASRAIIVESEEDARFAALQIMKSSLSAGHDSGSRAASEDPEESLFFYMRMRGAWGKFTGTGAGAVVKDASDSSDDAYLHGGGPTTHVETPRSTTGSNPTVALARSLLSLPKDPWFPQGVRGGFFNVGLRNWNEMRLSWVAKPPGFVMPPYPPEVDSDEVIEELSRLQRTYTLPGPMRLPDIIDLYLDCWDDELGMGV